MKTGLCKMLMLAAIVAVVAVGCAKKPKLNLAHLRDGNAGGDVLPEPEDGKFVAGGFEAGEQPGLPPGFVPADNTNAGGAGNDGSWQDMTTPLGGAAGDQTFLVNPKNWDKKVYFDYNRSEIKADQRPVLDSLAKYLTANAAQAVVIEGHCDERGSDEYNRSLSERRALAIRDYLNTLGIDVARMHTISYGEDRPEVQNATTENEHRLNRRGQFLVGDKK